MTFVLSVPKMNSGLVDLRSVGLLLTTAVQVLDYLSISNKQ